MVVPSPPCTTTRSTASRTACAAIFRALPGPVVACTSKRQPALRNTSLTDFTLWCVVRAAAGFVIRTARATSVFPGPLEVAAHLVALGRGDRRARHAGLDRLRARGNRGRLVEPVIQAGPEVPEVELLEVGAEAGVQAHEPLAARAAIRPRAASASSARPARRDSRPARISTEVGPAPGSETRRFSSSLARLEASSEATCPTCWAWPAVTTPLLTVRRSTRREMMSLCESGGRMLEASASFWARAAFRRCAR